MIPAIPNPPLRAHINSEDCIGCTKCLPACPVDAIAGSAKALHRIIEQHCIGCSLCVTPCPVDCIVMLPALTMPEENHALQRAASRERRLQYLSNQKQLARQDREQELALARKRREIAESVARVRAKKLSKDHGSQKN
jgi:electron transport complex protein RnfB